MCIQYITNGLVIKGKHNPITAMSPPQPGFQHFARTATSFQIPRWVNSFFCDANVDLHLSQNLKNQLVTLFVFILYIKLKVSVVPEIVPKTRKTLFALLEMVFCGDDGDSNGTGRPAWSGTGKPCA